MKLDEQPQGLLPLEPLDLEQDEGPTYPTVVQQAKDNMRKFENCVLLTRVGGFYEMYFEHADEYGPLLNLKVAQKKTAAGPVPMAGFPIFQLDRYLKLLVQDFDRYVAIAEEFPNEAPEQVKAGGLMHDRRVARIITPGTLIDENFMDPFSNNYVLAIHVNEMEERTDDRQNEGDPSELPIGLAWLDLSTGQFFTQCSTLMNLPSFLARIAPREIVLDEDLETSKEHHIFDILAEDRHLLSFTPLTEIRPISKWTTMLESPMSPRAIMDFAPEEVAAGSVLLQYVETRLRGSGMKLQPPSRQLDVMGIDRNTMRALEIKKTIREDIVTGSLLHTVRRTVTRGGARLLDRWLTSPSTSLDVINSRLDLVSHLLKHESLRERLISLLKRSHDSERLLQKFAFGRGDPDDLLALGSTIYATQDIVAAFGKDDTQAKCIEVLLDRLNLDGPASLASRIREAIDEEGVVEQHRIEDGHAGQMQALAEAIISTDGAKEDSAMIPKGSRKKKATNIRDYYAGDNEAWIMRPAASETLQQLHRKLASLASEKDALSDSLRERLGVTSLTLRFTPGLGHICHVKGRDIKQDLLEGRSVSSSKSTRSFHHTDWTRLGQQLDQCRIRIRAEEQRIFHSLREAVVHELIKLRRNATVLDEIDIACSFATLASEKRWTRPVLNTSTTHKIVGGRHPTVEGGLEEEGHSFVSNDCFVGDVQKLWLITGPNMAGKSTFLRQNALITILAQVGSYVPASYAELGIVDQIFSRVGSADNLYRDQSTFMVEMLETSTILKHATARSFVIMDEIGRGTTPDDGTAVAFACLWHLHHVNECRTLFATHFHRLADLIESEKMEDVGFYCTDVEEDGHAGGHEEPVGAEAHEGKPFRYIHKLREGVNRRSHALKVARLAGLPEKAIDVAKRVLQEESRITR